MAKLPESEIKDLAQQLTFEDVLEDYLVSETHRSEWDARVTRDKQVMQYKMVNRQDDRIDVQEEDHKATGLRLQQLQINLGDYSVTSKERVRTQFDKEYVKTQVALKLNNARHAETSEPEEPLESMSREQLAELATSLLEAERNTRVAVLEEVQAVLNEASSTTKYWATDTKYTGSK